MRDAPPDHPARAAGSPDRPAQRPSGAGRRRAWTLLQWAAVLVLAVFVVRRLVPDLDLPDLGAAPDVTYAALGGGTHGPANYAGQVVVLNVWATWCPPCVVETPGFVDLQAEFAGDVQFLGVSQDDDLADVRAFAERYGMDYPLLVGPPVAGSPPPAAVLPTTLVIDRGGRVRMRHEGLLLEAALRPALRALVAERPPARPGRAG
ncbi:TlpA family protein disulfide reductase [Rubrivirga litoralis]|uniref:TlpA disulfide reductase family protein n=1 Tax=Rubrivirga litoralis TaxID=3075598 RepID=A0ABU3BV05_9BACT|nr:TlpA disulfide reductase family protein [Rubrivirga sp. F394]MDT0633065.1 TlpA disulfide reductase family protein [Rubrivirga sp. F394]